MIYLIETIVSNLFYVYYLLIIVYCIMSWIPRGIAGWVEDVRGALAMLVEPFLSIFRRFIPPVFGIDFSPIVAIFVLELIERVVFFII